MSSFVAGSNHAAAVSPSFTLTASPARAAASYGLADDAEIEELLGERLIRYLGVAAFHAGLLLLFLALEPRFQENLVPTSLNVRTIFEEAKPPEPPKPEVIPPKPLPQATSVARMPVAPPPVMTATSSEPSSIGFAVAPQPAPAPPAPPDPPVVSVAAATPAAVPVTAARFDADYLKNPPPAYPALSRRMREEGKVWLQVQVSAKGMATDVRVRQTSGSNRLDEAAIEAVRQWHFVPAKRGDEAIVASVVVPIVFRIE